MGSNPHASLSDPLPVKPIDPLHDIDARRTTLWVVFFTLMVFVGMWLLSAAYGAILEQELQQKVFDREPEELNALRAVERAELSKSEDLGGGYERISIEEAMRRLAPR